MSNCTYESNHIVLYILQLFVKHLPTDMTSEEITELFTTHGKVFDVQKHPNRRNVAFVVRGGGGGGGREGARGGGGREGGREGRKEGRREGEREGGREGG